VRSFLWAEQARITPLSLDKEIGDEGEGRYLGDLIEDESNLNPAEVADKSLLPAKIEEALETLKDPRDKKIICFKIWP